LKDFVIDIHLLDIPLNFDIENYSMYLKTYPVGNLHMFYDELNYVMKKSMFDPG
tara:strand:+ start:348 stop:509 length:162 start_codon:yes stop_codon:yes gene_type:complete